MMNEELHEKLANIRQIEDAHERIWSLLDLAEGLDDEFKTPVHQSALDSFNPNLLILWDQKAILIMVRFVLELDERFRPAIRHLLRTLTDDRIQLGIVEELIFQLLYGIYAKAYNRERGFNYYGVLTGLFPRDSLTDHLLDILQDQYLALPHMIHDWNAQAEVLVSLVLCLGDEFKESHFDSIHAIDDELRRNRAIRQFEHQFIAKFRTQVLKSISELDGEKVRCDTLLDIAPSLSGDEHKWAIEIVLLVRDEDIRGNALVEVARFVNDERKVSSVLQILERSKANRSLNDLKKYVLNLPPGLQDQALDLLQRNASEEHFSEFLIALAASHGTIEQSRVLYFARAIKTNSIRQSTWVELYLYLDDNHKVQLLQDVQAENDSKGHDELLTRLLRNIRTGTSLMLAIQIIFAIQNRTLQDRELERLAQHHSEREASPLALLLASAINDDARREEALASVLQRLKNNELKTRYLKEARSYAQAHFELNERWRASLAHLESETRKLIRTDKAEPSDVLAGSGQDYAPATNKFPRPPGGKVDIEPISTNTLTKKEEVFFSAFHPTECLVEFWQTLLIYTHIESALTEVLRDAEEYQGQSEAYQKTEARSKSRLARGTEITVVPSCKGVTFDPERSCFAWKEDFQRSIFRFKAGPSRAGFEETIEVTIYAGPLIVANLRLEVFFNTKVGRLAPKQQHIKMYGNDDIFISYSRKDLGVARTVKNVLEASGFDVFLDVDDIKSGQYWKQHLKDRIERAQIFQLFWSSNYKRSKSCQMEWKHALRQKKPEGYIRPVFWKQPLAPKPPKELSRFNFQFIDIPLTPAPSTLLAKIAELLESLIRAVTKSSPLSRLLIVLLIMMLLCASFFCLTYYAFVWRSTL